MNASMKAGHICKSCGWPVIYAWCRDGMSSTQPYANSDWWVYCSQKTCEHHAGQANNQNDVPNFVHVQQQPDPNAWKGTAMGL